MGTADREGQRDVALQELGTPTEGPALPDWEKNNAVISLHISNKIHNK